VTRSVATVEFSTYCGCNSIPSRTIHKTRLFSKFGLQNNAGEYTILQTFSIACLLKLKHHVPQFEDNPSTIRARFLMGDF
jgi:hypothetical protein